MEKKKEKEKHETIIERRFAMRVFGNSMIKLDRDTGDSWELRSGSWMAIATL